MSNNTQSAESDDQGNEDNATDGLINVATPCGNPLSLFDSRSLLGEQV